MLDLPDEYPETLEHALVHIKEIMDAEKEDGLNPDVDQIYHDANIAFCIISNLYEKEKEDAPKAL